MDDARMQRLYQLASQGDTDAQDELAYALARRGRGPMRPITINPFEKIQTAMQECVRAVHHMEPMVRRLGDAFRTISSASVVAITRDEDPEDGENDV